MWLRPQDLHLHRRHGRDIQSAWRMPDEEKEEQESRPFRSISDSFKKIIVTWENVLLKRDESGVVTIPVTQFLKDPNSLDL